MLPLSERVDRDLKRLAQLKGRRKAQLLLDETATPDDYVRLLVNLGGILVEYIPWVQQFQVRSTEADNQVEFAPVAALLAKLTADTEYVNSLIEEVMQAFS